MSIKYQTKSNILPSTITNKPISRRQDIAFCLIVKENLIKFHDEITAYTEDAYWENLCQ